jgi:hypothetical protein
MIYVAPGTLTIRDLRQENDIDNQKKPNELFQNQNKLVKRRIYSAKNLHCNGIYFGWGLFPQLLSQILSSCSYRIRCYSRLDSLPLDG